MPRLAETYTLTTLIWGPEQAETEEVGRGGPRDRRAQSVAGGSERREPGRQLATGPAGSPPAEGGASVVPSGWQLASARAPLPQGGCAREVEKETAGGSVLSSALGSQRHETPTTRGWPQPYEGQSVSYSRLASKYSQAVNMRRPASFERCFRNLIYF